MKKSQILAALALASALGVAVIPTADTYASISDTTASESEIQEVYKQIGDLNDEYAQLQLNMNFNSYSALYKLIEGENGGATVAYASTAIADKINKWEKGDLVDWFNDHMAKTSNYINTLITNYNNTLASSAEALAAIKNPNAATVDSSALRLNPVTKISTVSEGYDALENLLKTVDSAHKILLNNYGNATPATDLRNILTQIDEHLNDKGNGSDEGGWLNRVNNSAKNIFYSTDGQTTYVDLAAAAGYVKNISKSAYDTMSQNSTWKAAVNSTPAVKADATGMQLIDAFGVLTETARGLEKWNYVGAVVEGKDKTNAIANTAAGAPVVNYDVAVKDVADFKTAIENFRNGKPADGTGEGTNKPGDEAQDPNAPDTGILADAEANASTTVAMVAGIATALTAAGAGVVAYRNARRSTRK